MNIKLLENKVAIITGGSSGIGLAIAKVFAEEGAKVVITGRTESKLSAAVEEIKAIGGTALGVAGDVCEKADILKTIEKTIEAFGQIDILVNNAGHSSGQKTLDATSDEFLDAVLDANLRAPFIFCREVLGDMLKRNSGTIINVSSVNGVRPITGTAYCASKFGMVGFTQNLALRCRGTGVKVNNLCPGSTVTPMVDKESKIVLGVEDGSMQQIRDNCTDRDAACTSLEVAHAALFLASDLSNGCQGMSLVVDKGGYL